MIRFRTAADAVLYDDALDVLNVVKDANVNCIQQGWLLSPIVGLWRVGEGRDLVGFEILGAHEFCISHGLMGDDNIVDVRMLIDTIAKMVPREFRADLERIGGHYKGSTKIRVTLQARDHQAERANAKAAIAAGMKLAPAPES